MANISETIEKVCDIVYDFMTKLYMVGINRDKGMQFAMSILCEAKGKCDFYTHVKQELSEYSLINTNDLDFLVADIRNICKEKIEEILPASADILIGESLFGECMQPRELTELILALMKERGCKDVYNPFAGFASYAMDDSIETYYGQELDSAIYNIAKLRLELNDIDNSHLIQGDSIGEWHDYGTKCIVSTPPFGIKFSPSQRNQLGVSTVDEFLLSKFISGNTDYGLFVVPRGLCFKSHGIAHKLREDICNRNLLEMVINLPSGIFSYSGVSTSIIVLSRCRGKNDLVHFVDAEKLFSIKNKIQRVLKVEDILKAISSADSNITYRVSCKELYANDCSFDVVRYASQILSVSEGQEIVPLSELMIPDKGDKYDFHNELVKNVVVASNYVSNIVHLDDVQNEILVNQPKHKYKGPHLAINLQGKIYVHRGASAFHIGTALSRSVFKVNENRVNIEYLAYKLLESDIFEKVIRGSYIPYVNTGQLLTYKIVIDIDKEKQRRIVSNARRRFLESEHKRLGIREAGGDLSHMLGRPKETIGNLINMLLSSETISKTDCEAVRSIKDNFDYMNRLIDMVGADFLSMSVSTHEVHIAKLVKEYALSLRNLQFANIFNLKEEIVLPDNVVIDCDEDMIRVILDTAFRNAYIHGFEKRYSESNVVKLGCRAVEYDGCSYACITIANNGNPIANGFSIEDFATRGKKVGKMGTGKGGYHIYTIAKRFNGYINISSSKEWSFILDVLIPARNIDCNDIIEEYGSKCI